MGGERGGVAAAQLPSAVSFVRDWANLLTLAGLACGVTAIFLAIRGDYHAAMIALLWALFCDWFDGPIARRTANRTEDDRAFGGQLDSLVDIVCSAAAPATILLCIGDLNAWFLPGAFLLLISGALRLAHFNIFGLRDGGDYCGLPIDTNIIVVTAVFAFRGSMGQSVFPWVLYGVVVLLAALGLGPFKTPKLVGGWYYAITAYVLGMTGFYAFVV